MGWIIAAKPGQILNSQSPKPRFGTPREANAGGKSAGDSLYIDFLDTQSCDYADAVSCDYMDAVTVTILNVLFTCVP